MGILDKLFGKKERKELVENPKESNKKTTEKTKEGAIEALIRDLKDDNPNVQKKSAKALGKKGDKNAVEPLIQALKDGEWELQRNAAEALGTIGGERAIDALIHALKEDKDSYAQDKAGLALGKIGEPAVEPLIQAINDENEARGGIAEERITIIGGCREIMAKALGTIGDERAVEYLIQILKDGSANVREVAAKALGKIGEPAVKPLINALKDEDEDVVREAVCALGKIGDARAVEPLIQALKHENEYVIREAVCALGKIGWQPKNEIEKSYYLIGEQEWDKLVEIGKPAVEPLIQYLWNTDYRSIAKALGKIGDARAVEPLINTFRDFSERSRWSRDDVVCALVDIGEPAVEPLIQALKHENKYVIQEAAKALGKIGDAGAVDPFIQALKSAKYYTLGAIGEPATEIFIRALEEEKDKTNKFIVHCPFCCVKLGIIEVPKGIGMWGKTFECKECELSLHAMYTGELLEVYAKALPVGEINKWTWGDPIEITKGEAILALSGIGKPAVEPLIQFLKDDNKGIREGVAWALGEIGDNRAVEPLIQALNDEDENVQKEAAWALGEIGDNRAVEPLSQALKDNVKNVRDKAAEALKKIG